MKDFKKFREHVYDLAKRRFGEISLEIDQRLNLEFEAIRVNRRTLMLNTVSLILRELDADNSSFEIRITYTERLRLDRKMRKLLGIERYESIPLGDSQTMESLYNLDLYGTSYSLDMITYESIRKIKPRTISELAEALAFWHDRQYPLLVEYLTNKSSQATVYTGDTVIDEILGHTHGILLYTRQQEAYMKRLNELSCADLKAYDHCNAYLQRQLKHAKLRNKCSEYVKALNLYRLAYIKVYYPEVFQRGLESYSNL